VLDVHEVGHSGGICVTEPSQRMGRYGPHWFAVVAGVHAESSGTLSEVVHLLLTHCAMSAVPWQALGTSQLGAVEYAAGQSVSLAQQSPEVQQKPFWQ
jgi:hypothetical protein